MTPPGASRFFRRFFRRLRKGLTMDLRTLLAGLSVRPGSALGLRQRHHPKTMSRRAVLQYDGLVFEHAPSVPPDSDHRWKSRQVARDCETPKPTPGPAAAAFRVATPTRRTTHADNRMPQLWLRRLTGASYSIWCASLSTSKIRGPKGLFRQIAERSYWASLPAGSPGNQWSPCPSRL